MFLGSQPCMTGFRTLLHLISQTNSGIQEYIRTLIQLPLSLVVTTTSEWSGDPQV